MSQAGATSSGGGGGNVVGPSTSTNRAIPTFNGTTGELLFNNPTVQISSAGALTNTTQPAFLYTLQTSDTNAVGGGHNYTFGRGNPLTQIFDQGNNCTTGGVFTAPVTGIYCLNFAYDLTNFASTHTQTQTIIETTANYLFFDTQNLGIQIVSSEFGICVSTLAPMSSGDTATFLIYANSSQTVTVTGVAAGSIKSYISGYLVC